MTSNTQIIVIDSDDSNDAFSPTSKSKTSPNKSKQNVSTRFKNDADIKNRFKNTSYYHQKSKNYDILVPEQNLNWSHNFLTENRNLPTENNRPEVHQRSAPQINQNLYHQQEYYTATFPYVSEYQFQPGYYSNGVLINNYVPHLNNNNNNVWLNVKLEEIPNQQEVVSQYYFDTKTQTPIALNNIENKFTTQERANESEYIDINTLIAKNLNNEIEVTNLTKNKKIIPSTKNKISATKTLQKLQPPKKEEDNDVIFVKEFKNRPETTVTSVTCSSSSSSTSSSQSLIKNIKTEKSANKIDENIAFDNIVKTYHKLNNNNEPRRNPKRQVQIERDYMKLFDENFWEMEKENKIMKVENKIMKAEDKIMKVENKIMKAEDKIINVENKIMKVENKQPKNLVKIVKKPTRKSSRLQSNCGAIYSPPSPVTHEYFRKWPTEGMHERPEYDPITGKIEPFDHLIKKISENYNNKNNVKKNETKKEEDNNNKNDDKNESLSYLCHEMLHHMISYIVSVKSSRNLQQTSIDDNKLQFFKVLNLVENNDDEVEFHDGIKGTLKKLISTDENDTKNSEINNDFDENLNHLKKLFQNAVLLYCLTNNVEQSDLIAYIDNLKIDDIVQYSNEKLQIS